MDAVVDAVAVIVVGGRVLFCSGVSCCKFCLLMDIVGSTGTDVQHSLCQHHTALVGMRSYTNN